MVIKTITGESLKDYFLPKIPSGLIPLLWKRLQILALHGCECIGAFVFPAEESLYFFTLDEQNINQTARVYISFHDVEYILVVDVLVI